MTVCFLCVTGQLGGTERSLLDIVGALIRHGDRVQVILAQAGPLVGELASIGVVADVVQIPEAISKLGDATIGEQRVVGPKLLNLLMALPACVSYVFRLRAILRSRPIDLVHSVSLKMHIFSALAVPSRIPLVWSIWEFIDARPLIPKILRLLASIPHAVAVNSLATMNDCRKALGPKPALECIYPSINVDKFTPTGPALNIGGATVKLGLISAFGRGKGHNIVFEALSRLPPTTPPLTCFVIGAPLYGSSGSQYERRDLQEMAKTQGVNSIVEFLDFQADVPATIRALDIVVHASTAPEGFGRIAAEAMACGRAVIVSMSGGSSEVATHRADALCYEPGDVGALSAAVFELAANAKLRGQLGCAARQSVVDRFCHVKIGAQWISFYATILDRAKPCMSWVTPAINK